MNAETAKDYLPLVKALAEGKTIQLMDSFTSQNPSWSDLKDVLFDYLPCRYRIKPEPRKFWLVNILSGRQEAILVSENVIPPKDSILVQEILK